MNHLNILLLSGMLAILTVVIACTREENKLTGEVDASEIDVGVKIPGRISQILVQEGILVKKGQIIGYMESKEIEAKMKTINAALKEAEDQFDFADKSFQRIKRLYKTEVVPKQQYDEITYKYSAAKQKIEGVKGQKSEVEAAYNEMAIKAPIDGEVVQIVSHAGEIVSPGYPVITIVDLNDQWITFNVREDRLIKITKGKSLTVFFPALGKSFEYKVSYLSALGTFAKWKATGEQGSFDLKTFEVRGRSDSKIEDLRPGMSAIVAIK
ncbi:MAG: efflux RND transporter periplasmic adaptor subunit [Oligoflexia bacterium]|nr:efflux RND transporter periplasmic adaptor subunit [Oligoflexia bacterium]